MRARAIVVTCASTAIACSAILGLQDRTLRDGGTPDAGPGDVTSETAQSCNDAGFCACNPHDFCDDFDSYKNVADMANKWSSPSFGQPTLSVGGVVSFDGLTTVPPSPPNALLTQSGIPNPLSSKLAAAVAITQLNGKKSHQKPIIGLVLEVMIRPDVIDPDGSAPILDSGNFILDAIIAIAHPLSKNGVGIALSENGGYIGYGLDLLNPNGSIAQGSVFLSYKPVQPIVAFENLRVIVAQRKSAALNGVVCKQGPVLSTKDAEVPDASGPPQDENMVVAAFTPLTNLVTCEVLSADLAFSDWISNPYIIIGTAQTGPGKVKLAYDNVTVDFLTE